MKIVKSVMAMLMACSVTEKKVVNAAYESAPQYDTTN